MKPTIYAPYLSLVALAACNSLNSPINTAPPPPSFTTFRAEGDSLEGIGRPGGERIEILGAQRAQFDELAFQDRLAIEGFSHAGQAARSSASISPPQSRTTFRAIFAGSQSHQRRARSRAILSVSNRYRSTVAGFPPTIA